MNYKGFLFSFEKAAVRPWRTVGSSFFTSKLPKEPTKKVLPNTTWTVGFGEHWLVTGPNGSGKSTLVKALFGGSQVIGGRLIRHRECNNKTVSYVSHAQHNQLAALARNVEENGSWNRFKPEDLTVQNVLKNKNVINKTNDYFDMDDIKSWMDRFQIAKLQNTSINALSAGEMRKVVILRSLLQKPRLLILDEIFDGLDFESRKTLQEFLCDITEKETVQLVVISHRLNEVEMLPMITHVLNIGPDNKVKKQGTVDEVYLNELDHLDLKSEQGPINHIIDKLKKRLPKQGKRTDPYDNIINVKNLSVSIEGKPIIKGLNWTVPAGSHFVISGENGCGKSFLLSLLNGDNCQAYSKDITILGKTMDEWSKQSIFSLRKEVVMVSPKVQMVNQHPASVLKTICSGNFGTFGYCPPCSAEQIEIALVFAKLLGILHLKDNLFTEISQGEQRRVLIARALACQPKLLLLDEPFHGLDSGSRKLLIDILNQLIREDYCSVMFVSHHNDEVPSALTHELKLVPTPDGSIGSVSLLEKRYP